MSVSRVGFTCLCSPDITYSSVVLKIHINVIASCYMLYVLFYVIVCYIADYIMIISSVLLKQDYTLAHCAIN